MQQLQPELAGEVKIYRPEVRAGNSEDWAQVQQQFRVGPRLPLLVLFAEGRWQRSLQGPAPEEVVRPFINGALGFDAAGNVL